MTLLSSVTDIKWKLARLEAEEYPLEDSKQLLHDVKRLLKSERDYLTYLLSVYTRDGPKGSGIIKGMDANILEHEEWAKLLCAKIKAKV